VDSNGWLLAVLVTAACVQDRDGGHRLLGLLRERFSTITLVWADGGYAGRLVVWATAVLHLNVSVVKRSDDVRGFVVVPRRWVVERTFGWLSRYRRLVRDYERRPEHHQAMVLWATTMIMTRQLAHQNTDQPAHPRWGGERRKPLQPADDQKAA
jgi:transposase